MTTSFLPQIRKAIAVGFKGRLRKGKLRKYVTTLNDLNDPVVSSYTDYTFDGMSEDFDARYAAQAGIPDTDVKVLVILGSLAVEPDRNDNIFIDDNWLHVREILGVDPARATMSLQCYKIPSP